MTTPQQDQPFQTLPCEKALAGHNRGSGDRTIGQTCKSRRVYQTGPCSIPPGKYGKHSGLSRIRKYSKSSSADRYMSAVLSSSG
uniref:Uncharacterized protein n=1 Tax=Ulva partita TaxID=1605170 RepID=A0A1C9ZS02_9CHLO|nr:hypothetical protein [Ulva partita]BAV58319.1 hypothetical protein [Ulva partita]